MRKPASDSIAGQVEEKRRMREPAAKYPVPDGMEKLSEPEQTAWDQYTEARDRWKQSDLRALHKLVKMEASLVEARTEAACYPLMYQKESGDYATTPIHAQVLAMQRELNSQLRVLGLTSTPSETVKTGASGKPAGTAGGQSRRGLSLLK